MSEQIPEWERKLLQDDARAESLGVRNHGLYYVDRNRGITYVLDGYGTPNVDRPERDVLIALLQYALDKLREGG